MKVVGRVVVVLGFVALMWLGPAGAAGAQECTSVGHAGIATCGTVQPAASTQTPVTVAGVQVTKSSSGGLPVTGGDVAALVAIAVTGIGGGAALAVMSKRRSRRV